MQTLAKMALLHIMWLTPGLRLFVSPLFHAFLRAPYKIAAVEDERDTLAKEKQQAEMQNAEMEVTTISRLHAPFYPC